MKINRFFKLFGRLIVILLIASVAISNTSCKSSKKAAKKKAETELREKKTDAMARLQSLLNPNNTASIDEKYKELNAIKSMNLNDPEISSLIARVEAKLQGDREKIENTEEEEDVEDVKIDPAPNTEALTGFAKLDKQFDEIASSTSVDLANRRIEITLKSFESDNAIVLILISKDGNIKDYDKPTTIRRYLEYLKDHKKNPNKVIDAKYNSNGKISELEISKK